MPAFTRTRTRAVSSLLALLACAAANPAGAQEAGYRGIKEDLPIEAAPQPVPFSHKLHMAAGTACKDCHENAAVKERAGLPAAEKCMLCHRAIATEKPEIAKLAEMHKQGRSPEWVRVYKVPDFVFFNHSSHVKAGVECQSCHGPVETREVLAKEVSTSMTTCMDCHAGRKVSNECHLYHDLGQ
jgi:hypothetical protein